MPLIKLSVIVGFSIGAVGVLVAFSAEDRSFGFGLFMVGFIIATLGIIANMFSMPSSSKSQSVMPGLKVSAIGFGIAAIGGGISSVLGKEELADVFFYIGFGVLIIGIFFGILGVSRSK